MQFAFFCTANNTAHVNTSKSTTFKQSLENIAQFGISFTETEQSFLKDCDFYNQHMDLSANFAGKSIFSFKVMHCLFLIILFQIFEKNWDQVHAKRLRRAPSFVGLEAAWTLVRHVDLLCFASNFCFIGSENLEDERIVVFVHVACAQVPAYDGFTAADEVQFPLLMAEKSASLPTLQKQFMHLMNIRYIIFFVRLYILILTCIQSKEFHSQPTQNSGKFYSDLLIYLMKCALLSPNNKLILK